MLVTVFLPVVLAIACMSLNAPSVHADDAVATPVVGPNSSRGTVSGKSGFGRCSAITPGSYEGYYCPEENFSGQVLHTSFVGSVMPYALFIGSDLRHANFAAANLVRAHFEDSDLSGAALIGANLGGADFRGANLTDADLRGANLTDADFSGAVTTGMLVSGAIGLETTGLPARTATATRTVTTTVTKSPTVTKTVTVTKSPTATSTVTPTVTISRTPTLTPTVTTSRTPTATSTATAYRSPTVTATATISKTPTMTKTVVLSNTPTKTVTATVSKTPTVNMTTTRLPSTSTPTATATAPGGDAYTALVAGEFHTCGLATGGTAYCWGGNYHGQIGDGMYGGTRRAPVAVNGGRTYTALVAGWGHTCGLATGGMAYCWGGNANGQLGNGESGVKGDDSGDVEFPQAVSGGRTYTALVAGQVHTCGLATGGTAYCWGYNGSGELGDGTVTNRLVPVPVSGGRTYTALAAGDHITCGLATGGTAYCWGGASQPGDGTVPVAVSWGRTFTALVLGGSHTCGLATGGTAYCWGNNVYGELGDGTSGTNRLVPVPVSGGRTYTALAAGQNHTCGLATGGTAYCWGGNGSGELGDGTGANRLVPVDVTGGRTFTGLVARGSHTCGLATGGTAYCWGLNGSGQLGDGTSGVNEIDSSANRLVPVAVNRRV